MNQPTLFAALAAAPLALASVEARAADLSSPTGMPILTIVGAIENTNRPGFDPFDDAFTKYHDRTFENAAEFDLEMLESLGMHEVEVSHEPWPRPVRFAGPLLDDVLAAVGAQPERLTSLALDGFQTELTDKDLAAERWIVAIEADGEPLAIGQRGPAWIVFDPGEDGSITAEEEMTWPWAAFLLEVE